MLPLWKLFCLMYPLHDRFNDNKVLVTQPVQQRIHAPPHETFHIVPVLEYVPVERNVKHFCKLEQQIYAGGLSLVFKGLDVPGNVVDDL